MTDFEVGMPINHSKYGVGVVWREDRLGRFSAKFTNGREIGALTNTEMTVVKPDEVTTDMISSLKTSGLMAYVKSSDWSDTVGEYRDEKSQFESVWRKSLDKMFPKYRLGSNAKTLQKVVIQELAKGGADKAIIDEENRVLGKLDTAYKVVRYIADKLDETVDTIEQIADAVEEPKEVVEEEPRKASSSLLSEMDKNLTAILGSLSEEEREIDPLYGE